MFLNKGNILNGIIHFSPSEVLEECLKDAILVDLRREFEYAYKKFNVPHVIYQRPDYVREHYSELPKDIPMIFGDNAGLRSREIVEFLLAQGFNNVANLAGGMFEWDKDNLPILVNNKERLSGSCLCVLRKTK
ncbi:MAG: rhodanese-like domain-containing protein [Melioribacteraceae bacterium]|nr:rhodanese-like domain-containing protein [Melioribacteraceae bacterium]